MQGCPLRCLYCHNPDTWDSKGLAKYQMTPEELLAEVLRYKNFIAKGGVTVTGGEPLLQAEFLREFFRLCREAGIHTALDTSGYVCSPKALTVLEYADLVLLDIKTIDPELHPRLTAVKLDNTLRFLDELEKRGVATLWLEVRASNAAAIALYESLGFNEATIRRNYYPTTDGREDAIIMALPISM